MRGILSVVWWALSRQGDSTETRLLLDNLNRVVGQHGVLDGMRVQHVDERA